MQQSQAWRLATDSGELQGRNTSQAHAHAPALPTRALRQRRMKHGVCLLSGPYTFQVRGGAQFGSELAPDYHLPYAAGPLPTALTCTSGEPAVPAMSTRRLGSDLPSLEGLRGLSGNCGWKGFDD